MKHKIPFLLALLTMIGGVFIAILFGANEDMFKDKILRDLNSNQSINQISDEAERNKKIEAELSKNWRYYQRYHFHSTGIGAMSLAALLLMSFVTARPGIRLITSYFIAVGGFLYPFVWLFAGIYGPIMGKHAAKESFAIFGYMGGVFLVGLLILFYLVLKHPLQMHKNK